jgi:exopolysaccharide biosynthesis protein
MEFYPALIVDGENVVDGTYCMGIQPRTSIGQTENGDFLLLVVDGRQVGYSLGCTVADCRDILMRYHAYQAMNMDGGSSSVMYYKGQQITKSSSATGLGRYMPNAFVVKKIS